MIEKTASTAGVMLFLKKIRRWSISECKIIKRGRKKHRNSKDRYQCGNFRSLAIMLSCNESVWQETEMIKELFCRLNIPPFTFSFAHFFFHHPASHSSILNEQINETIFSQIKNQSKNRCLQTHYLGTGNSFLFVRNFSFTSSFLSIHQRQVYIRVCFYTECSNIVLHFKVFPFI